MIDENTPIIGDYDNDLQPNKPKDIMKLKYRIQNQDGTFLNAGTGLDSWFTLENARKLVDYSKGQRIVEHDGMNILWEIL